MEYPYERRGTPPWVWVLIVLAALILIFVVWWAVAAQPTDEPVVVTPGEREAQRPPREPEEQPVVVERERPVNIYVERERPSPNVIVVPRDEQPPNAREDLEQVNVPSRFRYQGMEWEPANQAENIEAGELRDTGATIQGNPIYVRHDAERPYNRLYLETEPGSDVYIRYTRA